MGDALSADVKASLNWLFQETLDLATVADAAKLEYSKNFVDGTATDQADKLWHDQRTPSIGTSENLDLTNLSNTIFGSTVTVSFAKVKALLIVNTSTIAGDNLVVGGAGGGGAAWSAPFDGDADAKVVVPPDSVLLMVNRKAGWTVTNGSADILKIANAGTTAFAYRIAIIGTSA
jgi:hypothetical protein